MQPFSMSTSPTVTRAGRKAYLPPHLESLGSVRDIVQGGATSVIEGNPGQGSPQGKIAAGM